MLDLHALTFYLLVDNAVLMDIEEYLASLDDKKRVVEETRFQSMGYNVGRDSGNDTNKLRGILGNG